MHLVNLCQYKHKKREISSVNPLVVVCFKLMSKSVRSSYLFFDYKAVAYSEGRAWPGTAKALCSGCSCHAISREVHMSASRCPPNTNYLATATVTRHTNVLPLSIFKSILVKFYNSMQLCLDYTSYSLVLKHHNMSPIKNAFDGSVCAQKHKAKQNETNRPTSPFMLPQIYLQNGLDQLITCCQSHRTRFQVICH